MQTRHIIPLAQKMLESYDNLHSWRLVGEQFGIPKYTAYDIAFGRREPRDPEIRKRLGLPEIPVMKLAPACPNCGEVHVTKRCTRQAALSRQYSSLIDIPLQRLEWMLQNREVLDV